MVADGWRAFHPESNLARDFRRLDIEIVEHLDVIAQKTDRHDDRRLRIEVPNRFLDVGFEPRVARTATAALIRELPGVDAQLRRDHPRRLRELLDVRTRIRHRERNTVRREYQSRARPLRELQTRKRFARARRHSRDKQRMIMPRLR